MPARPRRNRPSQPRVPEQGRSRARKRTIVLAATQVFAERGYSKSSVAMIAQRAQVPVGSVYQYFPNKGELVGDIAANLHGDQTRMAGALTDRRFLASPLATVVARIVEEIGAWYLRHDVVRLLLAEADHPDVAPWVPHLDGDLDGIASALVKARAPHLEERRETAVRRLVVYTLRALRGIADEPSTTDARAFVVETKTLLERFLAPYDREPARK